MNTNSNAYTIIYTTAIVIIVAAVLAYASLKLKPRQTANIKAETLSQMMTAAQLGTKEEFSKMGNDAILAKYADNIQEAFTVNLAGDKVGDLGTSKDNIELVDNFKPQNIAIKSSGAPTLPVYKFKSGVTVVAVYGAGLWGPIWGYIALQPDLKTIVGAYFDHESETPGLGAKIKDDPNFQKEFQKEVLNLSDPTNPFDIVKGGAPKDDLSDSKVDAITGATMTSRGLDAAIDTWIGAYSKYLEKAANAAPEAAPADTTNVKGE